MLSRTLPLSRPRVAVLLSGCGAHDGSEITESVSLLVSLDKRGASAVVFAPDKPQLHTVNHLTGEEQAGARNCLREAARIARGDAHCLATLVAGEFDALLVPGGFGVAKNLSNFSSEGPDMTVDPLVASKLMDFSEQGKPVGLCCIAPVLAAKAIPGCSVTVGSSAESRAWPHAGAAGAIADMGAVHVEKGAGGVHVDRSNNVVTAPAYMHRGTPGEVFDNVDEWVGTVLSRIKD